MDTADFLRKILPPTGLYVIGRSIPGRKGLNHQLCTTIEEAARFALLADTQGVTVYHACAAFRDEFVMEEFNGKPVKRVRCHSNVRALKCFFMDLDVDPTDPKKYASQAAALDGLIEFCATSRLPFPMVIDSGYGVHIYWTLTDEIIPEVWKQTATSLKALATALEFKADPACTSDQARVLRPIGTANRKVPTDPRIVRPAADADPVTHADFRDNVLAALRRAGVKAPDTRMPAMAPRDRLNEQFAIQRDFPLSSAKTIATKCAQLREFRDKKGCISEPHWYAAIQLMCHTTEGDELIHEWSSGHKSYSAGETDGKIAQIRGREMGPAMCKTFEDRNPGGCKGCPFQGAISSPVQLGAVAPEKADPPPVTLPTIVKADPPRALVVFEPGTPAEEITLPDPPHPFTRAKTGGIFMDDNGVLRKIHEYDIFPVALEVDDALGFENIRIRHYLPNENWDEFLIPTSLLAKPTEFLSALYAKSVKPLIPGKMVMYIESYARKLQTETTIRRLGLAMGWKDTGGFVLGERMFKPDGGCVASGASGKHTEFLRNFHSKGNLGAWTKAVDILNIPGREPHMFMFLLAFAAPLLHLSGYDGFMVSAHGITNAGKSTIAHLMMSVYGKHKECFINRETTYNALLEHVGALHSLPAYIDELTAFDPKEVRNLAFAISQGAGKIRLDRNSQIKPAAKWQTICVVSTNESIHSKLAAVKANAEAESLRVLEFSFPRLPDFEKIAAAIHYIIQDHYGVAGDQYIRYLVDNRAAIRLELREFTASFKAFSGAEERERYWNQAAALALFGGRIANELGLINVDLDRVAQWLVKELTTARTELRAAQHSPADILNEYLTDQTGSRIVTSAVNIGMATTSVSLKPGMKLTQRYERDTKTLYVSQSDVNGWMTEKHHNTRETKMALIEKGILLRIEKVTLGKGTDYPVGRVWCWVIKGDHPDIASLTEEAAT